MKLEFVEKEKERIKLYKQLVQKLEEYIKLLGEEVSEVAVLAHIHGWSSSRVEEGIKRRKEIEELKEKINSKKEEDI